MPNVINCQNDMRDFLKRIICGLFVVFLLSTPAAGYVLPGPHVLELMTANLGKAKRLLVTQKVIFIKNSPANDRIEFNETLRYVFKGKFRSDILYETGLGTYIESKDTVLKAIDGKFISNSKTAYDYYKDPLLYRSRVALHDKLSSLGVDVFISSLGRFQGKLAYVLGAQYPDESISQVWFDKETFLPMRWLIFEETGNDPEMSLEVRYLDWRQFDKSWYPMHIEFYKNGSLIREIYVADIEVNPDFEEALFDMERFMAPSSPPVQDGPGQEESDGVSDVRKTIEEFKKIYEQ